MAGNREEIRVDDDTGRRIYLMRIKNIFERTDRLLVSEKSSDYVLILPAVPVAYEQKAAEEFNLLLKRAAGIALPMDSDNNSAKYKYRIFLGNVNAIRDFNVVLSYEQAGSDGFYIKSLGDDLLIAGVDRGTLFGVYGFLPVRSVIATMRKANGKSTLWKACLFIMPTFLKSRISTPVVSGITTAISWDSQMWKKTPTGYASGAIITAIGSWRDIPILP